MDLFARGGSWTKPFLCIVILFFYFNDADAQGTCTKINSCSCTYGENQVIDLSALQGNPKWADQYDTQYLSMYSYNPCAAFSEGNCQNVAVCQYTGSDYYECGTQDSAVFLNDPVTGALVLQYSSTDSAGFVRTSQVTLTCQEGGSDQLTVTGENAANPGLYIFELTSDHCCPKAGPGPSGGGGSSGLSIGSILVIVFFSVLFVYVVGGVLIMTFVKKKSGVEMIPNASTWASVPGLIKDGVLFVVRRGKTTPGYDRM